MLSNFLSNNKKVETEANHVYILRHKLGIMEVSI